MSILKLALGKQNAISGTIQAVTLDTTGKFGPQYKVDFTSGDTLYLPKDGFERQATRLNKLPNEMDGMTVTFWKKPMDNDPTGTKGYLNIDLGASGTTTGAVRSAAMSDDYVGRDLRSHGIPVKATTYEEIKDTYAVCLGDAISMLNDASETMGVPFTPAEYTSVAACLFIERNKRGV